MTSTGELQVFKSSYARLSCALLALAAYAGEAAAMGHWRAVSAPEIDGPAGVAAVALLVSAGVMAYHRLRR